MHRICLDRDTICREENMLYFNPLLTRATTAINVIENEGRVICHCESNSILIIAL